MEAILFLSKHFSRFSKPYFDLKPVEAQMRSLFITDKHYNYIYLEHYNRLFEKVQINKTSQSQQNQKYHRTETRSIIKQKRGVS